MSKHSKTASSETVDEQSIDTIKKLSIWQDAQLSKITTDDIDEPSSEIIAETKSNERFVYENGSFELRSNGLYYVYLNNKKPSESSTEHAIFICSPIQVIARTRDVRSNAWGILIRWLDADSIMHQHSISMDSFHGDTREYRKYLASQGLVITPNAKHRQYLDIYLQQHPIETRALCVDKLGWHNDRYVLQSRSLGDNTDEMIVYQSENTNSSVLSQKGTLVQWRDEICKLISEQSRLVFSICCAFAGQLLEPLDLDGGGFHMLGSSSTGKSITMCLAASIWGNPTIVVRTWRQTDNALEGTAKEHNDSILLLDEMGQLEPNIAVKTAYMLANGISKSRSSISGTNQKPHTWRLIFLSNGEQSIKQHVACESKGVTAGVEVRVAHIEADADTGNGIFDSLVMADSGAAQADKIKEIASKYYGTAGIAWLNYVTTDKAKTIIEAKGLIRNFMSQYDGLSSQAHRVAKRFSLVAAAGEIATQAGITGWQTGQATAAVKVCFNNWLDNYGRDGEHEERQIIKHVQAFIEQHGASRFQIWSEPMHDEDQSTIEQKTNNRVGFRRQDTDEYYFYPNMFEQEVCSPYSLKKVIKVLDEAGLLNKNEQDRKMLKVTLPNTKNRLRMYAIKGNVLSYEINKSINEGVPNVPSSK